MYSDKISAINSPIIARPRGSNSSGQLTDSLAKLLHEKLLFAASDAEQFAFVIRVYEPISQKEPVKISRKDWKIPLTCVLHHGQLFIHLKNFIGKGGFNKVYSAKQIDLRTGEVSDIVHRKARKLRKVKFDNSRLAKREINIHSQFKHPNIVELKSYISCFDKNGKEKIASYMEVCETSLYEQHEMYFMSEGERLSIILDIVNALVYLHKLGYTHNDLKLDNILIKNSRGKLADFGLCQKDRLHFGGFHKIYAPEQNVADPISSKKTDIYQFGLLLWDLFNPTPPPDHLKLEKYPHVNDMLDGWSPDSKANAAIKNLSASCLQTDSHLRPNIEEIEQSLKRIDQHYFH